MLSSFMPNDIMSHFHFLSVCASPEDPVSALVFDGSGLKTFIDNADELEAEIEKVFISVDKDHSGFISKAELRPALQSLGLAAGSFTEDKGKLNDGKGHFRPKHI